MRSFILAIQFITRLPTPQIKQFEPRLLSDSARWFAIVGLIIGSLLYAAAWLGNHIDPWLAALFTLIVWIGVTGGLHLDGLADLADAAGAAHRNPERFHDILKDPHMGSFGAIVLVVLLLSKLVLLMLICRLHTAFLLSLLLIPAWARLFAVFWAYTLPAKFTGSGALFASEKHWGFLILNAGILATLSYLWIPALLSAPVICLIWWGYLKYRIGGQTGDCLGAGIEISETLLLLLVLLSAYLFPLMRIELAF